MPSLFGRMRSILSQPAGVNLQARLAAYWKMDEGYAAAVDSLGTYDLARSSAAVAQTDGKINTAIQLAAASNQALSVASAASFQLSGSRTWAGWVQFTTVSASQTIFSKETAALREITFGLNASSQFRLNIFDSSNNAITAPAWTAMTPSTATWYFCAVYYDADRSVAGVSIDGGLPVEAAVTAAPRIGTGDLAFGRRNSTNYLNGDLDEWGCWSRVLSYKEILALYNAGSGKTYPFTGDNQVWASDGVAVYSAAPDHGTSATIATDSWANASDVNCAANRQKALATVNLGGTEWQAICYWADSTNLVIGVRSGSGAWTFYEMDGAGGRPSIVIGTFDAHNSAALGLDSDGFIHVCYDMHGDALNYRKSDAAVTTWTGGMTAELAMLGTNEGQVSYANFIRHPGSGVLYFLFRDGGVGSGDEYFYQYNTGTTSWSAVSGTGTAGLLINGITGSPNQSPYICHQPQWDSGNNLHFMFNWREDTADTSPNYNHDYGHFYWTGAAFRNMDGSAQTVPVTFANCWIAVPIAKDNYLLNQSGSAVDSNGWPHYAYVRNGDDDPTYQQIFHAWSDGVRSYEVQLTGTQTTYGTPTEDILTRPEIVIDSNNVVYVVVKNKVLGAGLYMIRSMGSDWSRYEQFRILNSDVGSYEPNNDPYQWRVNSKLVLAVFPWLGNGTGWNVYYLEWTP